MLYPHSTIKRDVPHKYTNVELVTWGGLQVLVQLITADSPQKDEQLPIFANPSPSRLHQSSLYNQRMVVGTLCSF